MVEWIQIETYHLAGGRKILFKIRLDLKNAKGNNVISIVHFVRYVRMNIRGYSIIVSYLEGIWYTHIQYFYSHLCFVTFLLLSRGRFSRTLIYYH